MQLAVERGYERRDTVRGVRLDCNLANGANLVVIPLACQSKRVPKLFANHPLHRVPAYPTPDAMDLENDISL
jgi:hypothetical protein